MGSNFSSQKQDILNQVITNIATNILSSVATNQVTSSAISQNIIINNGCGGICSNGDPTSCNTCNSRYNNCINICTIMANNGIDPTACISACTPTIDCETGFKVGQTAEINMKSVQEILSKSSTSNQTDIDTAIDNAMSTALTQSNSGINLGQLNSSNTVQNLKNIIKTNINASISNIISNQQVSFSNQNQDITINNTGIIKGKACEITQEGVISIVATQIADNILSTTNFNDIANKTDNDLDSTVSQKNEGIGFGFILAIIIFLIIAYVIFKTGLTYGAILLAIIGVLLIIFGYIIGSVFLVLGIIWLYYTIKSGKKSSGLDDIKKLSERFLDKKS